MAVHPVTVDDLLDARRRGIIRAVTAIIDNDAVYFMADDGEGRLELDPREALEQLMDHSGIGHDEA